MKENKSNVLFEFAQISKHYPGVQALQDVNLTIFRGEVRALVGENGAGKSTFVNVAGGVVKPDSGKIYLEGEEIRINSPKHADELGISIVHQELSLFPNMDVASNLFINNLEEENPVFVNDQQLRSRAKEILSKVGLSHVSPTRKVASLQPGEQQLLEIGRCLVKNAQLIILDEPTSSLADKEIQTLFGIMRELRKRGISIIFVSHRLDEVFEICDSVTVFRDGRHIKTVKTGDINNSELVRLILGRQMKEMYQEGNAVEFGEELLKVENLWQKGKLRGVSFSLRRGEILGIAGLLGSGRTELVRAVFGLDKFQEGEIWVKGNKTQIRHPGHAIKLGIGYITEDRHKEGLVLEKSIVDNIAVVNLKKLASKVGWMSPKKEIESAKRQKENLNIVTPSVFRKVKYLSGGNQQKVILGKWLEISPDIYILDEPTRGIDVGAKAEFYKLIRKLAKEGAGVVLISSELPEIVNICHRVLVLRNGEFMAEYKDSQINAEDILLAATGG